MDESFVEPIVTEEKLHALLSFGTEFHALDFKRKVDLDDHRSLVEFAKDIAAMRSCGGYLVIGADDQGKPVADMDAELVAKFDEATLRPKLEKFLPPTDVLVAAHDIDGVRLALVFVPRHPLGFTVVKALGEYSRPGGQKPKVVLRPGDVFIRRGTSSERWGDGDVEALLHPRDERLREEHRREFAATVAAIQTGAQGQAIAGGPVQALSWQLDQASFDAAVVELIRRQDLVPIRLFMIRTPGDARAAAEGGDRDELGVVLDRLVSLAATALTLDQVELADSVLEQLVQLYRDPPQPNALSKPIAEAAFWLEIITRVFALGGLAVQLRQWEYVRRLALPRPADAFSQKYWLSWLRHGLTMASRSYLFPMISGHSEPGGIIPSARRVTHRLPALRPYAADDSGYDPEPGAGTPSYDVALDALCTFDALANVIILSRPETAEVGGDAYPSFGFYHGRRSAPALARLVTDRAYRALLLPDIGDELLGDVMLEVSNNAERVNTWGFSEWRADDPDLVKIISDARERNRA